MEAIGLWQRLMDGLQDLVKIIVYFDPRVTEPQCKMPKGRLEPAFSQGGGRRVWFFLPWPMQGQVTARTSVKRSCWSCVPLESSFPEKGRKSSTLLWAAEWSQCTEGENGCPPWKGHGLPCRPSRREMAPWVLLVPLQTVVHLCSALSLHTVASACSTTLEGEEAPQGGVVRGRDTHSISLPWCFSIKSRTFINNKKGCMCRRHFSGEQKNTSHKHSWMDESREKDSQHYQFSYKRNLKSPRWCTWEIR